MNLDECSFHNLIFFCGREPSRDSKPPENGKATRGDRIRLLITGKPTAD